MIALKMIPPSKALGQYVRMHLVAEVENIDLDTSLVTPRGFHALIIVYKKQDPSNFVHIDFAPGVRAPMSQDKDICLIGHYTKSFEAFSKGKFSIVYTVFEPAGTVAFFGKGQHHFTDACIQLTDLDMNIPVSQVIEQMLYAGSDHERIGIVEGMLTQLLRRGAKEAHLGKFSDVAYWIIHQQGNLSVQQIADECGMSKRTLERKFIDIHGVAPKQYLRIVRFRSVMQYLQTQKQLPNWHDLLHRAHYYDQSHFIHDFQEFTGKSPSDFFVLDRGLDDAFVKVVR